MYYTDSHIHLQDYAYSEAKIIVEKALKNNVREFVVPSSNPDDWENIIKLTRRFENITGAIGIHPWYAQNCDETRLQTMEKYLQKYSKIWIGECGIDKAKNTDTKKQIDVFLKQTELANKYNRPLIIHSVKADQEISNLFSLLPKRTIFHSFTGSLEWGLKIQKSGFYLGLNFSFFKKDNATDMLKSLDLSKILFETDAPYQQRRGYVSNSPENLPVLASGTAAVLGLSETKISTILMQNWKNFNKE